MTDQTINDLLAHPGLEPMVWDQVGYAISGSFASLAAVAEQLRHIASREWGPHDPRVLGADWLELTRRLLVAQLISRQEGGEPYEDPYVWHALRMINGDHRPVRGPRFASERSGA